MESNAIIATQNLLEILTLIILSGVILTKISHLIHLPDVVMFIVGGVILGPYLLNLVNIDKYPVGNQFILTFGAAYILYDGGKEIKLKVLNKVKLSVSLLSTVGVIISTIITGYFAFVILKLDFQYALLLGSIVASTDPSVLVPLFKNMNISEKLKQTIISESAFNDAAGAIITFSIIGAITGGDFSIGNSALELSKNAGGGIIVGAIIGLISTMLIAKEGFAILREHPSEIAMAAVMGAYTLSETLGFSGFMSVFIVGIVCGNKKMLNCWIAEEHFITHTRFKEVLTLILRMMIFILLGTHIDFSTLLKYWKEALLLVGLLIFVARPVSAFICVILDKKAQWNYKEILYLMWVRETGVIPAALASMLVTMKLPNAQIISAVTFTTIIITLTFQASTSKFLARILKLEEPLK